MFVNLTDVCLVSVIGTFPYEIEEGLNDKLGELICIEPLYESDITFPRFTFDIMASEIIKL